MAVTKRSISTLIETQLPEFINTEYELFGNFLTRYYESLEIQGGPLDIANNLDVYTNIDYYESNLLKQSTTLNGNHSASETTLVVDDATSFPEENGYIKIGNEICFYKTRTANSFVDVRRGVSGNTKLGDLYYSTEYSTSQASTHSGGELVQNISNLFLYALVKNFEEQYLASFPEKYLKNAVDKRTLIKNIGQFYRSKGTEQSIQFLFNTVVEGGVENRPTVYNPSDFTYKSSNSDWTQGYALRVKVLSGDVNSLVGKVITQEASDTYGFASATVDNVRFDSQVDDEDTYNLFLATETLNGTFEITTKTELTQQISSAAVPGDRVNVVSTLGWKNNGSLLIDGETFTFADKNVTQFTIETRTQATTHAVGTPVYDPIVIGNSDVTMLVFGLVYNLTPTNPQPNASVGDRIEVSNPGFETQDSRIVSSTGLRWRLSPTNAQPTSPTNPTYTSGLSNLSTDVSAIFADDQFYYIASSGYPSYTILDNVTSIPGNLADQKILKLIRKESINTTEVYKTPTNDFGIFVNGVRAYGYKDTEEVNFGRLEEIKVLSQGLTYKNPPYVLINGVSGRAIAKLAGQFVESIEILEEGLYGKVPTVEITSGRGASVRATITGGQVTDIQIDNGGEYYSTPPLVVIRDKAGQGRLAEWTAQVTDGVVTGFTQINGGAFYTQENVEVVISPVGSNAKAEAKITTWTKDRIKKLGSSLDDNNGYVFLNRNNALEYGYAHIANPKSLRVELNDNLDALGQEPATKTHSPILGFAYDGNPIYGPFGYTDPLDSSGSVSRMTSSYGLRTARQFGPTADQYELGTFVQDYEYRHKSGTLDENNGRYCVTPDFPEGIYAYFLTIEEDQTPVFPYIIGENFYSLPVDSNYNTNLNQTNISRNVQRLFTPGLPSNGGGFNGVVQDLESGSIDSVEVVESTSTFSVGSEVLFDNSGTEGSDVEATVSSVNGQTVSRLDSFETKAVKLVITLPSYVFENDILRQPGSGAFGTIVGTIRNDNTILVTDVHGKFNNTAAFATDIKVLRLTLDKPSSYAQGSVLSLTDGVVTVSATGEVLESVSEGNTVLVKVLSGTFQDQDTLDSFLKSDNLSDTSGSKIDDIDYLSDGLIPFDIDDNIALVTTSEDHNLGIGDIVNVSVNPDDNTKTVTYYVRKRIYQEVELRAPVYDTTVNYSGIGRLLIVNAGLLYPVGTYTNIEVTGGNGENATVTVVVSPLNSGDATGYVSSVQIQNGGTEYKRGDVLSIEDSDLNRAAGSSTQRVKFYVDHVGVSTVASTIDVVSASDYANNDLLLIDDEIVKITSIVNNQVGNDTLTVERAQEGTTAVDHYDGAPVSIYKPGYNLSSTYSVNGSETIIYDREKQKLLVIYPSTQTLGALQPITTQTSFFDESTPKKFVTVINATTPENRFEFKLDPSLSIFSTDAPNNFVSEWTVNPIIQVQEAYRYVFDTSDASLTGSHLDFSPSGNFNLISIEKKESTVAQGNAGSFVDMKFGFGSRFSTNTYTERQQSNFSNFFYFDRNGSISSNGSYLRIVRDPLAGRNTVNFVSPRSFSYSLSTEPQWDGSGTISYTTTGQFAVGSIDAVSVQNIGANYKKVPIVLGVYPNTKKTASATVDFDSTFKTITGVTVTNAGSDYVNPKVIILDGDGKNAEFKITSRDGKVLDIVVVSPGSGYTKAPTIAIVESDVKLFAQGSRVGLPKNIKIIKNGSSFHNDKTILPEYTGSYVLVVKGYTGNFLRGENVSQTVNGQEVFSAVVREWREGSNLLKVSNIKGKLRNNVSLQSKISKQSVTFHRTFVTPFTIDLKPYADNTGRFTSDRGRIGNANQRISDSFFYQDYSYVVKSRSSIDSWRELVKETTHPAGFKLFGEVIIDPKIEAPNGIEMPEALPKSDHFSVIELWDPQKNKITVESTKRTLTQTIISTEDYRSIRGSGSVDVNEFDLQTLRARELSLVQNANDPSPFDGTFNADGQLVGTKTFTLYNGGTPYSPYSTENVIVTLDGVIQEPKVSYTVSGNQITFAAPPLGADVVEGQDVPAQKVVIRNVEFKDNVYNEKHFRKIRNFYQREGTWIDAANQIDLNTDFMVAETIGWFENKYGYQINDGTIPWTAIEQKFTADMRRYCDALQHDLRFGGNIKSKDYADLFATKYSRQNIQFNDALQYLVRLSKLATRNWDWIAVDASYSAGSNIINVQTTDSIVIGAYVSSGNAFPSDAGIRVTEIISDTQVRVSAQALASSATPPAGAAGPGITYLNGTQSGSLTLPTATGAVTPPNSYTVPPGSTLTIPPIFSGLNQVTFSMSGINNGTYYDASNLIDKNKDYIVDYVTGWAAVNYPNNTVFPAAVNRILDSIIFHLRFGGNQKLVAYAESIFDQSGPFAAAQAELILTDLCVKAMRQTLPGTTPFTNIAPFTDSEVITDSQTPLCAEVESTLNTYWEIVEEILEIGPNVIDPTQVNAPKNGYYATNLSVYTNYNILPDVELVNRECEDVVSALTTYASIMKDAMLDGLEATATLPDFIDGETKEFELYWDDDGSAVSLTETDENLLVALNGVIQRTKHTIDEPAFDAYFIDKSVVPNIIRFSAPPIWDQDLSARTIGEPTQVEKFFATGVGNQKRYTIDNANIDGETTGPHQIVSIAEDTILNIDDERFLLVILNGVIQKRGLSNGGAYDVIGSTINFSTPIVAEDIVDIRLFYGRDIEPTVTLHNYDINGYLYPKELTVTGTNAGSLFNNFVVTSDYALTTYENFYFYQQDSNGVYPLGKAYDWRIVGSNTLKVKLFTNNIDFDASRQLYARTLGAYETVEYPFDPNVTISIASLDSQLVKTERSYFNGDVRKSNDLLQRKGFFSLNPGDKIKVDGEADYRTIKSSPGKASSKDFRLGSDGANAIYGSFGITRYNGTTFGEGLSIQAEIENGSVTKLIWNERQVREEVQNISSHTITDASYDPATGVFVGTIPNHGFSAQQYLRFKNNSVVFTCALDNNATEHSYPRAGQDPYADKWILIDSVTTNTFTINVGVSSDVSAHTFVTSTPGGLLRGTDIFYRFFRPTAFNYYIPPNIEFIPKNSNGGGARARVVTVKGEIIGVQLVSGGSGYTEAPIVVATRKYNIIKQDDIKVSLVKLNVQSIVSQTLSISSQISAIELPPPEQALISTISLVSPANSSDIIEIDITPDPLTGEEAGGSIPGGQSQPGMGNIVYIEPDPIPDPVIVDGSGGILRIQEADREVSRVVAVRAEDIVTFSALQTNRAATSIVQVEVDNSRITTTNSSTAPGGYLQAPLSIGDDIVYISNTGRFSSNGKLLIGNEVVRYLRKGEDRFLNVTRGIDSTTEQNWNAGTFIREIDDYVSVAFGGVQSFVSETSVLSGVTEGRSERLSQYQVDGAVVASSSTVSLQKTQVLQLERNIISISDVKFDRRRQTSSESADANTIQSTTTVALSQVQVETSSVLLGSAIRELLFFAPPGGVVDYFQESIFFTNPITTRLNGDVTLVTRDVTQRNGNIIEIRNIQEDEQADYIGNYTIGNLGANIKSWNYVAKDEGAIPSSGVSLAEFELIFASMTIADFERRGDSNYTLTGDKFNLGIPTFNNPVTITSSTGTIGATVVVQSTTYFPSAGYVFTSGGSVIQYTGKTATEFTGCTLYSGPNTIANGEEIIPFTIS